MNVPLLAVVFSLLAALGFACGTILVRIGTQRVSASATAFFTVFTGSILLLTLALVFHLPHILTLTPVAWAWFALMGAMAYPIARVLINNAIIRVGASRASAMSSFQPIFALGLGVAFLGEQPNLLVALGAPVVVCGLFLVFLSERDDASANQLYSKRSIGYLLALGAAAAFGGRDVISRHVVSEISPPLVAAAFAMALGGCMLFTLNHRNIVKTLHDIPGRYIAICGLAGLVLGLAVASLFQALSRAPVTVVSPINASNPLITLLLAHLFLKRLESINLLLVSGTLLSVGGVVMVIVGAATLGA